MHANFFRLKDSKNIGNLTHTLLDQVSVSFEKSTINLSKVVGLHPLLWNMMMVASQIRLYSSVAEVVEFPSSVLHF